MKERSKRKQLHTSNRMHAISTRKFNERTKVLLHFFILLAMNKAAKKRRSKNKQTANATHTLSVCV